jgi:thioredoxin-related protein
MESLITFESDDWASCQFKAIRESKLLFVDFDADYCLACRQMEQTTYQNKALATFFDENIIAKRVDIEDLDGVTLSRHYKVKELPTMLIFDTNGNVLKRLHGYQSAEQLMKVLKELPNK